MLAARKGWIALGIGTASLVLLTTLLYPLECFTTSAVLLRAGRSALTCGDAAEAERLACKVVARLPHSTDALFLAAEAAGRREKYQSAVRYYDQVDQQNPASATSNYRAGYLLITHLGQPQKAEQRFRRALQRDPHQRQALIELAVLCGISGRRREADDLRIRLLREGDTSEWLPWILGMGERRLESETLLQRFERTAPDDPLVLMGRAQWTIYTHHYKMAETLLRRAVAAAPDLLAARLQLGQVIAESGVAHDFEDWRRELPSTAVDFPEFWTVWGDWERVHDRLPTAVRCYWESLRRNSTQQLANYKLAQALIALEQAGRVRPFSERAQALEDLFLASKEYKHAAAKLPPMRKASVICERLGLFWEARAWCVSALARDANLNWARECLSRIQPELTPETPRSVVTSDPAREIDLSHYPLPEFISHDGRHRPAPNDGHYSARDITLRDDAIDAGIDFTFFVGESSEREAPRTHEFTGGGVAVLDYDGDGWPDIYCTQGCRWPPQSGQSEHLDRLYRNLGDGRFRDITSFSGLKEDGYSQGVCAGDFNNDGFPDLYVGNIGRNRLYRNNGDGTFVDVTDDSGTAGDRWTTSCAMADLNGDGLPDLYAVNYLVGEDVFDRTCRFPNGRATICAPAEFNASQDEIYLNQGDGRFDAQARSCGIEAAYGKGLGIVVADLSQSGHLSVFVANDSEPNFLFVNQTPGRKVPRFEDMALVTGVAFDGDGRSQACMGVAAGDANGDGLLDLFVTNYYRESNTLYQQQLGGLFVDASETAGLRAPSLDFLGFGTQFLDADLDGWSDLMVANGHERDVSFQGIPYRMRAQCFRNTGGGRFVELRASTVGAYFEQETLGRALARIDWNRDGKPDCIMLHLDRPLALLTNTTAACGNFFAIELHGVTSARDAVGAVVRVTTAGGSRAEQLTAGDGYQASNERRLCFGLGAAREVEQITIEWPSGLVQQFGPRPANTSWTAVEGHTHLHPESLERSE